ncbi:MAG: DUF4349 domain-containing protein [Thermoleophilia bacterium]|nr:DUF4349 domain-containing protein [Thermoleophilia bacterium]
MTRKRKAMAATLALLLALGAATLAVACSGGDGESRSAATVAELEVFAGAEPSPTAAEEPSMEDAGGDRGEYAEAAPAEMPVAELADLPELPAGGPRVIQTASLTLAVDRGEFEEAIDRARTIAAGLGGFVTSSSASQGPDERLVRGTLVIRVPSRAYAQAMSQLARLGTVKGREEAGQDVSQQYVDLEARERHLEALERQLLTFLGQTQTIADALVVQDRLNQVQLQLEEIRGQLRYLDDQTSFSTISLTVAERGTPAVAPKDGGWRLGDAWESAVDGFLKVIGGVFVGLATAGPVLAGLAVAFLVWRIVRRRRRSSVEPPARPSEPATS